MKPGFPGVRLGIGLVVLLGLADPATAQDRCGEPGNVGRTRVSAIAGAVRYDLVGDRVSDGVEVGLGAGARAGGFGFRGGVHRVLLGDAPADPTTARLRLTREVFRLAGIGLCGVALAGGSRVSSGSDAAVTIGGGIGLIVGTAFAAGSIAVAPFLGTRVLSARSSGDVLGREFSVNGSSVGVEAGIGTAHGRAHASLRFAMDRFDPALGATSYPGRALRLSLGWRF